jgi:rhodanese-related sulfurtransferase
VFVLDDNQHRAELVRQCLSVGYEHLAGELDGGMAAWRAESLPESHVDLVGPDALQGAIVDVRQRSEYASGHIPGTLHIELGSLADAADSLPPDSLTIMCGHGERAMTGASILQSYGRANVSVLTGGPDDWATAAGIELARGA